MTSLLNKVWRSSQPTSTKRDPVQSSGFTPINAKSDPPAAAKEESEEESLFVDPRSLSNHEGNYIRSLPPGTTRPRPTSTNFPSLSARSSDPKMPKTRVTSKNREKTTFSRKDKTVRSRTFPIPDRSPSPIESSTPGTQEAPVSWSSTEQSTTPRRSLASRARVLQSSSPECDTVESVEKRSDTDSVATAAVASTMALDLDMAGMLTSDDQQSEALSARDKVVEESDDEQGETSEQEFEVEGISNHKFKGRKILLLVRWKGYNEEEDSWEPEDNLKETAALILRDYYDSIGGRPVAKANVSRSKDKANVSRRRKAIKERTVSPIQDTPVREPSETYRVPSPNLESPEPWAPLPPAQGNWEELIVKIDTLFKYGEHVMVGIIWAAEDNYGRRYQTRQDYWAVCLAAPNALLRYYESHVDFEGSESAGIPGSAIVQPKRKPGSAPQADMTAKSPSKKRKHNNAESTTTTTLPSRQRRAK